MKATRSRVAKRTPSLHFASCEQFRQVKTGLIQLEIHHLPLAVVLWQDASDFTIPSFFAINIIDAECDISVNCFESTFSPIPKPITFIPSLRSCTAGVATSSEEAV